MHCFLRISCCAGWPSVGLVRMVAHWRYGSGHGVGLGRMVICWWFCGGHSVGHVGWGEGWGRRGGPDLMGAQWGLDFGANCQFGGGGRCGKCCGGVDETVGNPWRGFGGGEGPRGDGHGVKWLCWGAQRGYASGNESVWLKSETCTSITRVLA